MEIGHNVYLDTLANVLADDAVDLWATCVYVYNIIKTHFMHIGNNLTVNDVCGMPIICVVSSGTSDVVQRNDVGYYLRKALLPAESFIVEDAAALFEKEYDAGRVIALADSKALIDN